MRSALTLLLLATLATAQEPNLIANPGFETLGGNGQPLGWSMPGGYTLSDENPHAGKHCLKYTNTDADQYRLCSTPVVLEPGFQYELSVWVRTADVEGNEAGATVCVEWSADGKYLGGNYPSGLKGTNETWREIRSLTARIPAGATSFTVHCYLRKGITGTAWFDDVSIKRYRPPLVDNVITNAYRNQVAGGTVDIHAGLNLQPNGVTPDQLTAELALIDEAGETVVGGQPSVTADTATWQIDAGPLRPGRYRLQVRAKAGELAGEAAAQLTKVAALPERKAWIDEHRRLILDGEPYFPLGTYWSGVNAADLELYARSPFNCLMPYGAPSRESLDLIQAKGLKVIYTIKDLYAGSTWGPKELKTAADERAMIERIVADKKDHPAIMAWYINDELPLTMLEQLTAHRDWMEELDPDRPTWVVLYQVDQVRSYLPTFDVIGTDPYPIPTRPASTALDYTRKTNAAVYGSRAVWQVPQIFNWAAYRPAEQHDTLRAPTYEEMRSMAWSCIAAGANGLIFYSFFDLRKMDKTIADGGKATVREPFDERWAEVCRMAQQIKDHTPVLLAAEPTPKYDLIAPTEVACRVWRKDGEVWLLAVNAGAEAAEAAVTWEQAVKSATDVLPEQDGTVRAEGRTLKLSLEPLGVQLCRVGF